MHRYLFLIILLSSCARYPVPTQPAPRLAQTYIMRLPVVCRDCEIPARAEAYGAVDLDGDCSTIAKIGAKWTYDYSRQPLVCPGVEAVPMIQAADGAALDVSGNSRWILGFNEPDMNCPRCWAYQSPEQAAQNWRIIEDTHADKLLVSPAPMSGATYDPANWLHLWRAAYIERYKTDPRLGALAVHVYFVSAANAAAAVLDAEKLAAEWSVPEVWISEWGLAHGDSGGQEAAFLDWLQTQPRITRYSWFGSRINVPQGIEQGWYGSDWADMSLVDWATRGLTGFGEVYRGYAPR